MVKTHEQRRLEEKWFKVHTGGFNPFLMSGSWIGAVVGLIIGRNILDTVIGFLIGWLIQSIIRHFKHKHKQFK